MLNQNYSEASAEVLDIINHMNVNEMSKISRKFINFLHENASKQYKSNLDYSKKLQDMNLREETKGLLAIMYRNYLCPKEKLQDLQEKFNENEQKYQVEIRKKYNPNNIFKKKNTRNENMGAIVNEDAYMGLAKYEQEKWYQKIFTFIKRLFRNN